MAQFTARLVGTSEFAALMGIDSTNFSHLRSKGPLIPEPYQQLRCGPIWLEEVAAKVAEDYKNRPRRGGAKVEGEKRRPTLRRKPS